LPEILPVEHEDGGEFRKVRFSSLGLEAHIAFEGYSYYVQPIGTTPDFF
jgi:hypothetical protein